MRNFTEHLNWILAISLLEAFEWFDHWAARRRARSRRSCEPFASVSTSRS